MVLWDYHQPGRIIIDSPLLVLLIDTFSSSSQPHANVSSVAKYERSEESEEKSDKTDWWSQAAKERRRIRRTWSKKIYIKATGAQLRYVISFFKTR